MEKNIVKTSTLPQEIVDKMELSASQYMKEVAKLFMDKIAVVNPETDESKTYAQVLHESDQISNYLTELGCGTGTMIAISLENRLEYLSILLAALSIGATCCLFPPQYGSHEIRHALHICQPEVVFTSNIVFHKFENILHDFSSIQHVINIDTDNYSSMSKTITNLHTEPSRLTDTAIILFSSGTTGSPKGVKISHKAIVVAMGIYRLDHISLSLKKDVMLITRPALHIGGLTSLLHSFVTGQMAVLIKACCNKMLLSYVEKYQPSSIIVSNSFLVFLLENMAISQFNLSYIELIITGGDSVKKELVDELKLYLKKCQFIQIYGLTEVTGNCTQFNYGQPFKLDSVGVLIPGMTAKVVDVSNSALGPFQKGELLLRGPTLMNGYCLNEQNNDLGFDEDGWFHTGDIVYYDNDFYFYIVERVKEMIKFQNYQVSPLELESILLEHDAVLEVGVIGIPNDAEGELPTAYVVKRMGFDDVTEIQFQEYVEKRVAPWKTLRGGVIFVEELPKTITGKVSRKDLKKWSSEKINRIS